jgi:membrane protein YdbS with pleckstrin-like domain
MGIIIVVLLLALILGGAGFAVHILWWIALAVLVLWLLGFVFRGAVRGRLQEDAAVPQVRGVAEEELRDG